MPPNQDRLGTWVSNGRLAIYLFLLVFTVYIGFNIWAKLGGGPPPDGLTPLVTAAFGFAVTVNSVEKRGKEERQEARADRNEGRVDNLEEFAQKANPEVADRTVNRDHGRHEKTGEKDE